MDLIGFAEKHIEFFVTGMLKLEDYQIEVLNHIKDNKVSTITKSRQVGMSTLYTIYLLWLIYYGKYYYYNFGEIMVIGGGKIKHDVKRFLSVELAQSNNYHLDLELLTNNSKRIIYNGVTINFIENIDISLRDFYDMRSIDVIIVDEAATMPHLLIFFEFIMYKKINVGITIASVLNRFHIGFQDISNLPYVKNYTLHYGKTPMWSVEKLEEHLKYYIDSTNNVDWFEQMECENIKLDDNLPLYKYKEIELKPFKTEHIIKLENELIKQLENYG